MRKFDFKYAWIAVALAAAGCAEAPYGSSAASASANDMKPVTAAAPASAAGPVAIPFNDMQGFDKELSRSLKNNPDKVTVVIEDRIPLKDMPNRVDKWLAAVDNGGGKVKITSDVPEPKTRALPVIGIAISAFQFFKEQAKEAQYDAAKSYDATVYYKRDANGDRIVDRIEMSRRNRGE